MKYGTSQEAIDRLTAEQRRVTQEAPGLSGALSERLHLSLPSSQLDPSQARDRWRIHGNPCSYWRGRSALECCTA